jgi:hypothetical protein
METISGDGIALPPAVIIKGSLLMCYELPVHLKITPRDFMGIVRMVRFYSPAGNCVTG